MRTKGKIASWNDRKGYGFINPDGGGKRVFVHIKAFNNRARRPEPGQIVSYTLSSDKQGRSRATQVTVAGDRRPWKIMNPGNARSIAIASLFLLSVAIAVSVTQAPKALFSVYLLASLVSFTLYAIDKSAAKHGKQRIAESTLHIISLLGGWPGAMVAQQKFRHKSRKQPFRTIFWFTVGVNCAVFLLFLSQGNIAILQSLLTDLAL